MTVPVSKGMTAAGGISLDAPIFDPAAFRLGDEQAAIITTARELGQAVFAGRAATYDREAKFPTENYADLHRAGLLVGQAERRGIENRRIEADPVGCRHALAGLYRHHELTFVAVMFIFRK